MANAKELKTGNTGAKRAGKAESFAVTQEAFDAAFDAGRAYAGAYAAAAAALEPLLAPLAGRVDDVAPPQWNELRRAFVLGMAQERHINPDSAGRAWQRIVDDLGFAKPVTPEAAKKAAKRAADKPAQPAGDADDTTPMDGAGEDAAAAVQMALTPIEAHIIAMLRAEKFTQAAQAVADLADAA